MAKKIVRNAGIVAFAGAALVGSTVPANAFAQVPAAADLSYDYNNYETDYTSYQTGATNYVAPQAEYQTEYVAPTPSFSQQQTTNTSSTTPSAPVQTATGGHEGVVATAKTGIGGGYVWGGRSFGAWDCSGFVSYVYAQHGVKLTPYTFAIYVLATRNALKPKFISCLHLRPKGQICSCDGSTLVYRTGVVSYYNGLNKSLLSFPRDSTM